MNECILELEEVLLSKLDEDCMVAVVGLPMFKSVNELLCLIKSSYIDSTIEVIGEEEDVVKITVDGDEVNINIV